jgi:hypothetical protein
MSVTDKLLGELNTLRGLEYPDQGFSYFANAAGDGRTYRSVYTIVNKGGGVTYSSLNAATDRQRCDKIRAAIEDAKES